MEDKPLDLTEFEDFHALIKGTRLPDPLLEATGSVTIHMQILVLLIRHYQKTQPLVDAIHAVSAIISGD